MMAALEADGHYRHRCRQSALDDLSSGVFWQVGRGGVEPPTFRFSEVPATLLALNPSRWVVPDVCPWQPPAVVVSTVVNPSLRPSRASRPALQRSEERKRRGRTYSEVRDRPDSCRQVERFSITSLCQGQMP
jgi:hypothetical protein